MKAFILRQLHTTSGGIVRLRFDAPKRSKGDWSCTVSLTKGRKNLSHNAYGIDALQALLNAMELARKLTAEFDSKLCWAGADDNVGLPAQIPLLYGAAFSDKMQNILEKEIGRFANAARRRRKPPRRTKAAL